MTLLAAEPRSIRSEVRIELVGGLIYLTHYYNSVAETPLKLTKSQAEALIEKMQEKIKELSHV